MGFKFAGTSPGNPAENYSAAVTDGHIDGPLHLGWNQRRVITTATDLLGGTVA